MGKIPPSQFLEMHVDMTFSNMKMMMAAKCRVISSTCSKKVSKIHPNPSYIYNMVPSYSIMILDDESCLGLFSYSPFQEVWKHAGDLPGSTQTGHGLMCKASRAIGGPIALRASVLNHHRLVGVDYDGYEYNLLLSKSAQICVEIAERTRLFPTKIGRYWIRYSTELSEWQSPIAK